MSQVSTCLGLSVVNADSCSSESISIITFSVRTRLVPQMGFESPKAGLPTPGFVKKLPAAQPACPQCRW